MVARIIPLLFLLLFLPTWVISRRELRPRGQRWTRWVSWALWGLNLSLFVLLLATGIGESYTMEADLWKGRLLTAVLLVGVTEAVYALCYILRSRLLRWAVAVGVFLALLYGFVWGWQRLDVRPYEYVSADVPAAFDGYRIVQVSDLHLGTLRGREDVVRRMVDSVNALRPDLIVLTGDLVNYHPEEFTHFLSELRSLQAVDGVVSIMGNHDYMGYHHWPSPADSLAAISRLQAAQRALGWHLLLNEHLLVSRCRGGRNDSVAILGLENDGPPRFPALADLKKAGQGLSPGGFQILLEHDPSYWRRCRPRVPLMLAGHTHGMQLRLFGWSPAAWFYPEWGGPYEADDSAGRRSVLYVSQGFGSVLLPFRFGAWPEINLITLRHANK